MKKRLLSVFTALAVLFSVIANTVSATNGDNNIVYAEQSAVLTFSDNSVVETESGDGYSVSGAILTITSAGTYRINGSCSDGSIVVSKGLSGVTLILENLTLSSSSTAPVVIKKSSAVKIHLEGTTTLTDNENPENENSSDEEIADTFEGAAIKVKSGSTITFCGEGNLNIVANVKNGIKGASSAALIFNQSGTVTVSGSGSYYGGTKSGAASNNGIACDGSIVFNNGNYVIKAANDGIKSAPDATDTTAGTTIDTDSAGTITVNGGTFDIDVDGDGIEADTALTVTGGTFDIQTWKGYGVWNDTLAGLNSCKGLKASGDRAKEAEIDPTLTITGGTFALNTGDDAVHSDAYVSVTGGTFNIYTGDDGMHADTSLTLGTEGGYERDPDVTINSSYEGLEGGTVYIYSGRYYVVASDDGVNAAGGSSNGTDPGAGGGNTFNPGGGGPGGPGGGGPGGNGGNNPGGGGASSSSDYNIYIYGGNLYVNCNGDGLDSNGGLYLYGGSQAVFSMKSGGDNSALDADGTISIQGAAVFTAGTTGMDGSAKSSWFGNSQKYATSSTSYSAGKIINTKTGSSGTVMFSYTLPKNVNYVMASWPSAISSNTPSFATATSTTECKGGSWSHSWNSGKMTRVATATETGIITYTCSKCGAAETKTIPMTVEISECDHSVEVEEAADEGFTVTFAGDAGVKSITVYETQDYMGASESVLANGSTVSRRSDTGAPDSTGSGQVNFTVILNDGYTIESVTATAGTYKNIKGPSDTGLENTYRITKVSNDLTISIATIECVASCDHTGETDIRNAADATCCENGYTGDTYCNNCGEKIADGTVIPATGNHVDTDGEWETDGSEHWHTCYYGTRFDVSAHTGGAATCTEKAKCTVCGVEYSGYGEHGETEIRNAKEATCCEDGYTGDTYCKDCNNKIANGSVIPATGNHVDADGKWETDGTQHWHTCYYGTKFDVASHTGGAATCTEKAKCSVCGAEYGDFADHALTHHDPVAPDYENDGNIEYWTCDECGKYFSDSEGHNEISADDVIIAKLTIAEYQFLDGEVIIEAPDGAIPDGSLFDVQKIVPPPAEVVEKVKEQMGSSSEVLAYYEIRLSDTEGELIIHLDGEITIKIQMPAQYVGNKCVKVLQEDETGKLIEMTYWWEGEYLCYKTDWLEIYD